MGKDMASRRKGGAWRYRSQKKISKILLLTEAAVLVAALLLLVVNNVRPGKITTAESRRAAVEAGTPSQAVPGFEEAAAKAAAKAPAEEEQPDRNRMPAVKPVDGNGAAKIVDKHRDEQGHRENLGKADKRGIGCELMEEAEPHQD